MSIARAVSGPRNGGCSLWVFLPPTESHGNVGSSARSNCPPNGHQLRKGYEANRNHGVRNVQPFDEFDSSRGTALGVSRGTQALKENSSGAPRLLHGLWIFSPQATTGFSNGPRHPGRRRGIRHRSDLWRGGFPRPVARLSARGLALRWRPNGRSSVRDSSARAMDFRPTRYGSPSKPACTYERAATMIHVRGPWAMERNTAKPRG